MKKLNVFKPLAVLLHVLCCAVFLSLFFGATQVLAASAQSWYVSPAGNDGMIGTNWATAKLTLQAAVNAAVSGDTVIATNGLYPLTGLSVGIPKAITLTSVNGASATIIDAQQLGRCITIDGYAATVNGFTLRNGKRTLAGGVYCNGGTILNCVLTNNSAAGDGITLDGTGGGAYLAYGTMSNCFFFGNKALSTNAYASAWGGAVYNYGGLLQNCIISNNQCTADYAYGAGAVLVGGSLRNSKLLGNATTALEYADGGGIYATILQGSQTSFIESCLVASNTVTTTDTYQYTAALAAGGGMYIGNGTVVRSCVIYRNTARAYAGYTSGGGIITSGSTVEGCTIAYNDVATYYGHVGAGGGWDPIVLNDLGRGGGVTWGYNDQCYNNIVKFNGANNDPDNSEVNDLSYPMFINSDIGPWYGVNTPVITRINTINADPLFVNAAANDFRLQSGSPCRDVGTNRTWTASAKDYDGKSRVLGDYVDMGAFEFGGTPAPRLSLAVAGSNVVLTWPVADAGFTLESTADFAAQPTWTTVTPSPNTVSGQNTVTNAVTGSRLFYRLRQ